MATREHIIETVQRGCARAGFDLVQPLQVGWYNTRVAAPLRLESFGSGANLGLVVGNTRALWPAFLEALAADAALAASPHPLDTYTARCLAGLTTGLGCAASLRLAHDTGQGLVAMQQLADAAGLAYLTETHQSVHPVFGPWLALRAAISFPVPGPAGPPPRLPHPCGGCAGRCAPSFERACASIEAMPSEANMRANWAHWVAWRDSCPVGREHRYSEGQLRYHYLREPEQLSKEWMGREGPA
jgi:cyanocobalamin reductase (cyanide-eliminating) / alkylcobalamin dealkylase